MAELLTFMAACNDWRNGQPLGEFHHAEFSLINGGCLFELECRATVINHNPKTSMLYIGRIGVPYSFYTCWLGNWCWDGFAITPESTEKILAYLRGKRDAQFIGGLVTFCEKLDNGQRILAQEIRQEMGNRNG